MCMTFSGVSVLLPAAKEAKAHDLAGDNEKDFDPFKDVERAAQKAAALAGANLKGVQSKVSHFCVAHSSFNDLTSTKPGLCTGSRSHSVSSGRASLADGLL